MTKWREVLAAPVSPGGAQALHAAEPRPEETEELAGRWQQHLRGRTVEEADAPPLYRPGTNVLVTPDEDDEDEIAEPYVGPAGEASWNLVFQRYVYPVVAPDGQEHWVFEHQLKPAPEAR